MKRDKRLGDMFQHVFNAVEVEVLNLIRSGQVKEEDHISSAMIMLARDKINQLPAPAGVHIWARQLTGRGPKSEESIYGADGAVVLTIRHGNQLVQKFYLFQAKIFKPKSRFNSDAILQRNKMLACTSDSFFLIYTPTKFYYISAFMVEKSDGLFNLPSKSFTEFNEDFFNCFIGDHFLGFKKTDINQLLRSSQLEIPPVGYVLDIEISIDDETEEVRPASVRRN